MHFNVMFMKLPTRVFWQTLVQILMEQMEIMMMFPTMMTYGEVNMSHFAYMCKTKGKNGISRLMSGLCVNCLISIPEYSRLNHLDVHLV